MSPSELSDPEATGNDIPSLRQMDKEVVASLVARALVLAPDSYSLRREALAFADSRTPWDATRLANALDAYDPTRPAVSELVGDLDREAEACAGIPLPNKRLRVRAPA